MSIVRKIYLYLFSLIGLVVVVIGSVQLVDLALKAFVFKKADVYLEYPRPVIAPDGKTDPTVEIPKEELEKFNKEQTEAQRQRQVANSLAMIIVGLPLYLYHWRIIKNEQEKS